MCTVYEGKVVCSLVVTVTAETATDDESIGMVAAVICTAHSVVCCMHHPIGMRRRSMITSSMMITGSGRRTRIMTIRRVRYVYRNSRRVMMMIMHHRT